MFRGSFFLGGGRDYYAIWVLPQSSSSSVILLSSSGEARGNVPALCLTTKLLWLGRFFGSVPARFFVGFRQRKDRFLSCYTRKSIRQRVLTADKTADAVCAKLLVTAVLATAYCAHKLHLSLRSGGILPASGRVFNGGIINRGHLFENRVSYLRRYAVCRF